MILYNSNTKELSATPIDYNGRQFDTATIKANENGIYEYVEPEYNPETQTLGAIYITEDNIATNKIINYVIPDWWITSEQLEQQLIYDIAPKDLIFAVKISTAKVKKNADYYAFATSIKNQSSPQYRIGESLFAFLSYLDTDDDFDLAEDGTVINPYSEDIELTQLTTNLIIDTDSGRIVINPDEN